MGGQGCVARGVHGGGGGGEYLWGRGHAWLFLLCAWCMAKGGAWGSWQGGAWKGGVHGGGRVAGGMCVGEMATEAGGTHPTGMHSCFSNYDNMTSFLLNS